MPAGSMRMGGLRPRVGLGVVARFPWFDGSSADPWRWVRRAHARPPGAQRTRARASLMYSRMTDSVSCWRVHQASGLKMSFCTGYTRISTGDPANVLRKRYRVRRVWYEDVT